MNHILKILSAGCGFLSILYSIGSKPLQIWDKKVRNGHIKRITDIDIQVNLIPSWFSYILMIILLHIQSLVLEIISTNVATSYITCPADPKKTLSIKLPYLGKYFKWDQIID